MAHTLRYPSPYSRHVLCSDVISRQFVTPSVLRTTRLVLKRGKVPAWAPRSILAITTSWILEETEIDLEDPANAQIRVTSRNIDHKSLLQVVELQSFARDAASDPLNKTVMTTLCRVQSDLAFWPLRNRLESFSLSRIPKATEKARSGLALVASVLLDPSTRDKLLSSGPLDPYHFDPIPSPLSFESMRHRFDEARRRNSAHAGHEEYDTQEIIRGDEARFDFKRHSADRLRPPSSRSSPLEGPEPGQEWRRRWRAAARNGFTKFRESMCALTGFMCDPPRSPSKEQ